MSEPPLEMRHIMLDAVCGHHPDNDMSMVLQRHGLMKLTGNQWNESWAWNRDALEKLSDEKIMELYKSLKRGSFVSVFARKVGK